LIIDGFLGIEGFGEGYGWVWIRGLLFGE